jgi:ATP-dependent DNA helicase RecG
LRDAGGDTDDIEVKSATGGLSASLTGTLCALANLPTGGWIILGLDEKAGFAPVRLPDIAALKQGLAGKGRACLPPVHLSFTDGSVDGLPVIVARVPAAAVSARPCRVASTGQTWIRSWDGDVMASPVEEQAFLSQRGHPDFDQRPVEGATRADLDQALVSTWGRTAADLDPTGLGRFSGEELLFRAGMITGEGIPTVAGLLSLGVHPQQFFPRFTIQLSVEPSEEGVRAAETTTVTGPIPTMLDAALSWARKNFQRVTQAADDGSVRERWDYPLEAFRELVGNALIHRDLDEWSRGEAIEVRLDATSLRITNPGGLFGITLDRLGRRGTTSARNARLIEVCRYARSTDGARVVEALASGIPRVFELVEEQGLPGPRFYDNSLRFTAILRKAAPSNGNATTSLNESQRAVYLTLADASLTAAEIAHATTLKEPTVRKALRALGSMGLTEQTGGRGKFTTYRRAR